MLGFTQLTNGECINLLQVTAIVEDTRIIELKGIFDMTITTTEVPAYIRIYMQNGTCYISRESLSVFKERVKVEHK